MAIFGANRNGQEQIIGPLMNPRPLTSAQTLDCRTRIPVAFASASSRLPLLLLRFEAGIGFRRLLLGMMYRGWLGANLPQFALVDAIRHGGIGGVLARLELRPLRLLRWLSVRAILWMP